MKKSKLTKILKWLSDVGLKSLAVFLIVAGAFYVYASEVNFPAFNPTPPTGVVGMFVGLSTEGYDDNVNGYSDLNTKCSTYTDFRTFATIPDATAHVCTPMEVINSYNFISDFENDASGVGIMNNGPPGYTVFANDCNGWTVKSSSHLDSPAFGTTWDFDGDASSLSRCDILANNTDIFRVACCE